MAVSDEIVVNNLNWYDDSNILMELLETARERFDCDDPKFQSGPKMKITITVEKVV